jgi:hypothetical protein
MGFTFVIAAGCAIFFGFAPLLKYGASDLAGQLRDGGAHGATGARIATGYGTDSSSFKWRSHSYCSWARD